MSEVTLPSTLIGNWIWPETPSNQRENHALFRKEFSLNETAGSADLWISCRSNFNIYINDQHLSFGPSPSINELYYVQYFDITYLLQTGKNVISIQASNNSLSLYGDTLHTPGLWCQVSIDNENKVATDENWLTCTAPHILPHQNRISQALAFVETQDLRNYPTDWKALTDSHTIGKMQLEGGKTPWEAANVIGELANSALIPMQLPEYTSVFEEFSNICARGRANKDKATLNLDFHHLTQHTGTYAANCYFNSETSFIDDIFVHADDSYKLYLNGKLLNSQGGGGSLNGRSPNWSPPMTCLEGEEGQSHCQGQIIEGWNKILVVSHCDTNSPGITINFNKLKANKIHIHHTADKESPNGWTMTGPLHTPFSHIHGSLDLTELSCIQYHNLHPNDFAAHLMSLDFKAESCESESISITELTNGEYIILDMGQQVTGTPKLTISGSSGDYINIIYGEICIDGKLIPLHCTQGRRTDTIILSNEELEWSSHAPRSFRYIGIHAHEVRSSCFIKNPGTRVLQSQQEKRGNFECNDEVLNSIYQISMSTLNSCGQYNFVNSPAGDNCQYIADAAIQGLTSIISQGTAQLSRKSLIEFALSQFETGEIPGAYPSAIYFNIPDYPLHWIKWLQKHLLFTDDKELLEICLPALGKLLNYYNNHTNAEHYALDNELGKLSFLDHDDIDRRGIVTGLNALYCRALHCAAWIFEYADYPESAEKVRQRASKVAQTMRDLTWNEEKGLFADCYADGKVSECYTLQTNVLAMYGALPSSSNYMRIFNELFLEEAPYFKLPTTNKLNPFFNYFLLETAFSLNQREWALEFIKWYWGGMAKEGASTWWEFYNPVLNTKASFSSSLCHGYGVAPNIYIFTDIVGIRPAAPGFEQVYFSPLPGTTEWIKANISTPHGNLKIDWVTNRDGGLDIEIKANYNVDVITQLSPEMAELSTFHVNDDVNIISE